MTRNGLKHNRSFIVFLLAAFMLFCMPTPLGDYGSEGAARSFIAHDAANSVKVTKRTASPITSKMLVFAALLSLFLPYRSSVWPPYRMPAVKSIFLPVISSRLRLLLLRPLKFTSSFVSFN